tara:strand:+ start:1145 stop:1450 length:306 start_codon:yes stop_codon:yes gene_type:complete
MKKLILMLMISFSAMADDAYEADLKDRIASKDAIIEKLKELNATTAEIAQELMDKNNKMRRRTIEYFDKMIAKCLNGDEIVIPSSNGSVYRFGCDFVEVAK